MCNYGDICYLTFSSIKPRPLRTGRCHLQLQEHRKQEGWIGCANHVALAVSRGCTHHRRLWTHWQLCVCSNTSVDGISQLHEFSNTSVAAGCRADFQYMLAQLQDWKARYGSCYVPRHVHDEQQLANWVWHTRQSRKKQGLTTEQVRQLDEIGFVWKPNVVSVGTHHINAHHPS